VDVPASLVVARVVEIRSQRGRFQELAAAAVDQQRELVD
jgi:hypothetical protein